MIPRAHLGQGLGPASVRSDASPQAPEASRHIRGQGWAPARARLPAPKAAAAPCSPGALPEAWTRRSRDLASPWACACVCVCDAQPWLSLGPLFLLTREGSVKHLCAAGTDATGTRGRWGRLVTAPCTRGWPRPQDPSRAGPPGRGPLLRPPGVLLPRPDGGCQKADVTFTKGAVDGQFSNAGEVGRPGRGWGAL